MRKQTWLRKNAGALTPQKTFTCRYTSSQKVPETSSANTNTHLSLKQKRARVHGQTHRNFSSASNAATEAPRSRNNRRTRGFKVRRLPEHATTLHDAPASALK